MNDIIHLTINMNNSKQDLLNFIAYFYSANSDEYEDANFLIQTKDDLDHWLDIYDGNPDEIDTYNHQLRRWKIEQHMNSCSYDDFADLCSLDTRDFIETFFQQRALGRYMSDLENYLSKSDSLIGLHNFYKQHLYTRVEYLISVI